MGRHEIRLRRQRMTSRRIDNHKNFMGVLQEHERTNKTKRLIKLFLLLAFFIGMMSFLYYVLQHTGKRKANDESSAKTEVIYNQKMTNTVSQQILVTNIKSAEIRS